MSRTNTTTLVLKARTAGDVMTPDPITVPIHVSIKEAASLLLDRGIGAAPVVDGNDQPVGVLSRSDFVVYERDHLESGGQFTERKVEDERTAALPEYYQWADVPVMDEWDTVRGFEMEVPSTTTVGDIMTPVVHSVEIDTPIQAVIEEMLRRRIHRLFVTNRTALVGVVSAFDILRYLGEGNESTWMEEPIRH